MNVAALSNEFEAERRWPALLLMLASGFAGLGYQIVWTQQSALWLGHEAAAVLAVVAAFFGGMAIGALALGRYIERSTQPARWYAACEATIALWSLLLAFALAPISTQLLRATGILPTPLWQWSVAFFGTFALLLPATAAMGATLPAMQRATAQLQNAGRNIALLYASNTFGAVLGVLVIAFIFIPTLGLLRTALICAALNLLCCAAALALLPQRVFESNTKSINTARANSSVLRLVGTGLLGIGYETLVVRVLSQVAEDTVYTFAILLAIYLIGSAIGASIYRRWLADRCDRIVVGNYLFVALALACLLGTITLWGADAEKVFALQLFNSSKLVDSSQPFISSMLAALGAETVLAVFAFGLPTIAMGALFSHLSSEALEAKIGFSAALAANTFGAAIAPLVFGVIIYPVLGPKFALLLVSVGYLALIAARAWRKWYWWLPLAFAASIAWLAPPLAFIDVPEGGRIVSYQEGIMAAVSVVEDADGVARLRINNRQQEGSSASVRVDARQALLPIFLHAAPRHVLFLGLGTGVTASAAAVEPGLQVDAAELLPEVINASHYFADAIDVEGPRPHIIAADARRYVRASDKNYDVIIADNFHPARSGSGSLYTVEHFAAVRNRLTANGIFCQWLPLHQLDLATLRSIVQSFLVVYPHGWAMLASNSLETPVIGLVGVSSEARFDIDALQQRLATAPLPQRLHTFGIDDEFALLGSFIAGPQSLQRFAGDAALNTDDHPVVTYRAPRITYAPDSLPRDRLIELLQQTRIAPDELIDSDAHAAFAQRLAAYWQARNRFVEFGRDVHPVANARAMLTQVREPLLSVLRISPDFRPAYDPLVMMANSLAQTNPPAARELLVELAQIQPARTEAQIALEKMGVRNP